MVPSYILTHTCCVAKLFLVRPVCKLLHGLNPIHVDGLLHHAADLLRLAPSSLPHKGVGDLHNRKFRCEGSRANSKRDALIRLEDERAIPEKSGRPKIGPSYLCFPAAIDMLAAVDPYLQDRKDDQGGSRSEGGPPDRPGDLAAYHVQLRVLRLLHERRRLRDGVSGPHRAGARPVKWLETSESTTRTQQVEPAARGEADPPRAVGRQCRPRGDAGGAQQFRSSGCRRDLPKAAPPSSRRAKNDGTTGERICRRGDPRGGSAVARRVTRGGSRRSGGEPQEQAHLAASVLDS